MLFSQFPFPVRGTKLVGSWAIFHVVGANPKMKSLSISSCINELTSRSCCLLAMYQFYQVMICLLKFDFFSFTGVTMQVSSFLYLFTFLVHWSLSAAHRGAGPQFR